MNIDLIMSEIAEDIRKLGINPIIESPVLSPMPAEEVPIGFLTGELKDFAELVFLFEDKIEEGKFSREHDSLYNLASSVFSYALREKFKECSLDYSLSVCDDYQVFCLKTEEVELPDVPEDITFYIGGNGGVSRTPN